MSHLLILGMWDALDDLANTAASMASELPFGHPEWGMKYGGLSQDEFAKAFKYKHRTFINKGMKYPDMTPLERYQQMKVDSMRQKQGSFVPPLERSPSPYIMISTPPVPSEPLLLMPSKAQRAAMYRQSPKSYRTSPYKFRPRK